MIKSISKITFTLILFLQVEGCDDCVERTSWDTCFGDGSKLWVDGEGGLWPVKYVRLGIGLAGPDGTSTKGIGIGGDIYFEENKSLGFHIEIEKPGYLFEGEKIIIENYKIKNGDDWKIRYERLGLGGVIPIHIPKSSEDIPPPQYKLYSATINIIDIYPPTNHASFEAKFVLTEDYSQYKDIMPDWITLKGEYSCKWGKSYGCKYD